MISIRRSMDKYRSEENDGWQEGLSACYLAAIDSVRNHVIEVQPDLASEFRTNLAVLRRTVYEAKSEDVLTSASHEFDEKLGTYHNKITQILDESKAEVQKIITLLNDAMASLADRNRSYDQEFTTLTEELENTALCDDLRQIRRLLTSQVSELRHSFRSMRDDSNTLIGPLQQQLQTFEKRLKEAELAAAVDPLTGLFNRREGERRAQQLLDQGATFCLLILDLNRFKFLNDRYGHACGDQVLQQFAKKLETSFRPTDTVCRWGGDEFLIVMACSLSDAMQRSRQVAMRLNGRYPIVSLGRKQDVELATSIGVAQCQPGDSLQAAFERADMMLYQIKAKSR